MTEPAANMPTQNHRALALPEADAAAQGGDTAPKFSVPSVALVQPVSAPERSLGQVLTAELAQREAAITAHQFKWSGYAEIGAANRDLLQTATVVVRQHHTDCEALRVEVGKILKEVKDWLDHGLFTDWVEAEFPFSLRTAERYMEKARQAQSKSDSLTTLAQEEELTRPEGAPDAGHRAAKTSAARADRSRSEPTEAKGKRPQSASEKQEQRARAGIDQLLQDRTEEALNGIKCALRGLPPVMIGASLMRALKLRASAAK